MPDAGERRTVLSPWWRHATILVMVAGFSVLSVVTVLTYTNAPPIPGRVADEAGRFHDLIDAAEALDGGVSQAGSDRGARNERPGEGRDRQGDAKDGGDARAEVHGGETAISRRAARRVARILFRSRTSAVRTKGLIAGGADFSNAAASSRGTVGSLIAGS